MMTSAMNGMVCLKFLKIMNDWLFDLGIRIPYVPDRSSAIVQSCVKLTYLSYFFSQKLAPIANETIIEKKI